MNQNKFHMRPGWLKGPIQVGKNLYSDRQASEVLYEMHNISENAQLIQRENPMLMSWIIFQSAGGSKLRVTDNRFWVKEQWTWCVQYHDRLVAGEMHFLKINAVINLKR